MAGYIKSAKRTKSDGRRVIEIDGRVYSASRLAFLHTMGAWPEGGIDHANHDPADNRWRNLRLANQSQNMANTRVYSNNTSGFKGVSWDKIKRKWLAKIGVHGKPLHLGYFDMPHLTYIAYCRAATKHFGEYGRLYDDEVMIISNERILRNLLIATQSQFEVAA